MTTAQMKLQHPPARSWPQDALRIGFGLIWLMDATLKWLPGFRSTYVTQVTGVASGQPGWLKWWFDFWIKLEQPRPTTFAYLVAVIETLIAIALIIGFARKLTYIISAAYGLSIWSVAEGFGGPYATGHTDVGAGIIYTVVSLGLLALCYYAGVSRHSVDYYLERSISWWWRIAEMRRPDSSIDRSPAEAAASIQREPQMLVNDVMEDGVPYRTAPALTESRFDQQVGSSPSRMTTGLDR